MRCSKKKIVLLLFIAFTAGLAITVGKHPFKKIFPGAQSVFVQGHVNPSSPSERYLAATEISNSKDQNSRERKDFSLFKTKNVGSWKINVDENSGLIKDVWGDQTKRYGRTPVVAARNFVSNNEGLVNAGSRDLRLKGADRGHASAHVTFQQTHKGIPVEGAVVQIHLNRNGKVVWVETLANPNIFLKSTKAKISSGKAEAIVEKATGQSLPLKHPPSKLVILPDGKGKSNLCWKVGFFSRFPLGDWIYFIDTSTGTVIASRNDIWLATGTVTGKVLPVDGQDALSSRPISNQYVNVGTGRVTTGQNGSYASATNGSVTARLEGPWARIINEDTAPAVHTGSNYSWTWDYATANTHFDELNAFYHINIIHDYFKTNFGISGIDYQIPATVHKGDNFANAYYSPSDNALFFGDGDDTNCRDSAKGAEVIYHEYGHATHDHIYNPLTEAGIYSMQIRSMGEAWADYFAEVLTNDDVFGEWWVIQPSQWRHLDNTKRYPNEMEGEEHADGPIYAGSLWDYRQAVGSTIADRTVVASWYYRPTDFRSGLLAMLQADDELYGDMNLSNGTPHKTQIQQAFANHGISTSIGEALLPVVAAKNLTPGVPFLFMMNSDGSASRMIPGTSTWDWPDWNENTRIVVASGLDSIGNKCIYWIDPLTELKGQITSNLWPTGIVYAQYPSLSPTGTSVAYSWAYQGQAMYNLAINDVVNPDPLKPMGTEVPGVDSMDAGANQNFPDWSKANNKILYSQLYGPLLNKNFTGLWVVNPNGSGLLQRTHPLWGYYNSEGNLCVENDMYPKWSHSGEKIAYVKFISGTPFFGNYVYDYDIYVMRSDGSDAPGTRVLRGRSSFPVVLQSHSGLGLGDLSWSPSDDSIMFGVANSLANIIPPLGGTPNSYDLWKINTDGTGLARLTTDSGTGGTATSTWGSLDTSAPQVSQVTIDPINRRDKVTFRVSATDPQGGIYNFQYAIGSSPGSTNTRLWTTIKGSATSVTATRLSLIHGSIYYVSVKTKNGVGLISSTATSSGAAANYDITKPTITALASPSHPVQTTWYKNRSPVFRWSGSDPAGIAGYSHVLNRLSSSAPDTTSDGTANTISYSGKADGTWYFHLRAVDNVGNWGDSYQFKVNIDSTRPRATIATRKLFIRRRPFNIRFSLIESMRTSVKSSVRILKGARIVKVLMNNRYLTAGTGAGIPSMVRWDGKDSKRRLVSPGIYYILLRLADRAGNGNTVRARLIIYR